MLVGVFNEIFIDKEMSNDFKKVMAWKFAHLFSDTGGNVYNVSYVQARSILNSDGAYRKILVELDQTRDNHLNDDKSTRKYHEGGIYLMAHLKANGNLQVLMKLFSQILRDLDKAEFSYRKVFYQMDKSMDWSKHD